MLFQNLSVMGIRLHQAASLMQCHGLVQPGIIRSPAGPIARPVTGAIPFTCAPLLSVHGGGIKPSNLWV